MKERSVLPQRDWRVFLEGPAIATLYRYNGRLDQEFTPEQIEKVADELSDVSQRLFLLYLTVIGTMEYKIENYLLGPE